MRRELLKINGEWIPVPTGNLEFSPEKVKTEKETEAGTTVVIVTRPTRFSVSGKWQLSGAWIEKFREYREADTVTVEAYYPKHDELTSYVCQFEYDTESLVENSKLQLEELGGLYEVSVTMTEL